MTRQRVSVSGLGSDVVVVDDVLVVGGLHQRTLGAVEARVAAVVS